MSMFTSLSASAILGSSKASGPGLEVELGEQADVRFECLRNVLEAFSGLPSSPRGSPRFRAPPAHRSRASEAAAASSFDVVDGISATRDVDVLREQEECDEVLAGLVDTLADLSGCVGVSVVSPKMSVVSVLSPNRSGSVVSEESPSSTCFDDGVDLGLSRAVVAGEREGRSNRASRDEQRNYRSRGDPAHAPLARRRSDGRRRLVGRELRIRRRLPERRSSHRTAHLPAPRCRNSRRSSCSRYSRRSPFICQMSTASSGPMPSQSESPPRIASFEVHFRLLSVNRTSRRYTPAAVGAPAELFPWK